MTTDWKWAWTAGLLVAVGACLAWVTPAAASPGDLSYAGCMADNGEQGCVDLPGEPLQEPRELAPSPDGRSLYVGTNAGALSHFFRDPTTGRLSWGSCFQDSGKRGCVDAPGAALAFMGGVAVSPNGRSVYGVSDRAIIHLFREPDGRIAWDGCLGTAQGLGCGMLSGSPLDHGRDVAVSPDGGSVYAAARSLGSVAHFSALVPEGQISYVGCLASEAQPPNRSPSGCGDIFGDPLNRAEAMAMSADGRSIYLVAFGGSAIGHFSRNTENGNLSWRGCLNNDGSQGCDNLLDAPLTGANGVEVSPDGRSVYVISSFAGTVSHFGRNPMTGELTWEGCLSNDGSNHCTDVPGEPFRGMEDLAASPDGTSVYVASSLGLVAHLTRNPAGGRLGWDGCYGNASEGCVSVPAIQYANSVAVTADGASVYVTDAVGNAVTHLRRELEAPAPPPPPGTSDVDRVAPAITSLAVSRRRFRVRATFRYELSESAAVAVKVQRARRKRWVPAGRALARTGVAGRNRLNFSAAKLKPGRYRARFVATDAAGNRSRPVTVRFRVMS